MNLYKINATFLGKDLSHEAIAGYLIAKDDNEVYKKLSKEFFDDENWADYYEIDKKEIIKNKGDVGQEYMGEFYDIKYSWDRIGIVTNEEIKILKKFDMLKVGVNYI